MSILDEIVAHKRTELEALPETTVTLETLRSQVAERGGVRDFVGALALLDIEDTPTPTS